MKVGLIDVDGHNFPNLPLMKLSAWHKRQGDSVEWYEPLFSGHLDRVYMSKVFTFTPDYPYYVNADEVIKGGTGYDITSRLPSEIERFIPDYDLYNVPHDTAYGFLTRGCPNKCKWCVVPKKEGYIAPYMDIEDIAIEKCGFYLPEEASYTKINDAPDTAEKATLVKKAMDAIEKYTKQKFFTKPIALSNINNLYSSSIIWKG